MPLVLRSLTVSKEEAALVRVALAVLAERKDILSPEGRKTLKPLADRVQAVVDSFPKETA